MPILQFLHRPPIRFIQLAIDFDAGKAWIGYNNTYGGTPGSGTNPAFTWSAGGTWYFVAAMNDNDGLQQVTAAFAAAGQTYSPPSGFAAWDSATNTTLVAGAGSYALTGTAASLLHGWKVAAGAGSYALTGTDAALNKGQRLTAGAGSYALTGTDASLLHKRILTAGAGSYALTGTAATLRRNLPLVAGAGSYALTGTAATLIAGCRWWPVLAPMP